MTPATKLALNDTYEIEFDGMKFIGLLTEIAPDLRWEQKPGGSSVTGSIRLTLEVGAMGPGTLEELTEWLRRRKQ